MSPHKLKSPYSFASSCVSPDKLQSPFAFVLYCVSPDKSSDSRTVLSYGRQKNAPPDGGVDLLRLCLLHQHRPHQQNLTDRKLRVELRNQISISTLAKSEKFQLLASGKIIEYCTYCCRKVFLRILARVGARAWLSIRPVARALLTRVSRDASNYCMQCSTAVHIP